MLKNNKYSYGKTFSEFLLRLKYIDDWDNI